MEQGANNLHIDQLMPLIISCFTKILTGFAFLVLAYQVIS